MVLNFDGDVLEASHVLPIVVDFWAPWCGPCRFLGPNLDKLAEANEDKWKLVKINVDEHQDISNQFGIRGIPAVKMFSKGKIIAEFTGALPPSAIEKWLDENLPNESKEELKQILLEEKDIPDQTFIDALKAFSERNLGLKDARLALARHLVFVNPEEAVQVIEDIRMGEEYFDTAEKVRQFASFMHQKLDMGSPTSEVLSKSQQALRKGDLEQGIIQIIEANRLDKNFMDDLPRLTAISVFGILGAKHDLTKQYRRQFDMVLY